MSETKKKCSADMTCNMELAAALYRQEVLDALEEAVRISRDSNSIGYESMDELKKALES